MLYLYLETNRGKYTDCELIGEYKTKEEVLAAINRWFNKNNYHSHYMRHWQFKDRHYIDFGDWHRMFCVQVEEKKSE